MCAMAHYVSRYSVMCCARRCTMHSSAECTTRYRVELHWFIARGYDCYRTNKYLVARTNQLKYTHMSTDTRRYVKGKFRLHVQNVIQRTCISSVKWSPKSNRRSAVVNTDEEEPGRRTCNDPQTETDGGLPKRLRKSAGALDNVMDVYNVPTRKRTRLSCL